MSVVASSQEPPHGYRILLWSTGLLVLACYLAAAASRTMNSDEGFYAAATHAVAEGKIPYRDFGFTLPPLITYVNAQMPNGTGFGLFQQRAVNGFWSLIAFLLATWLIAHRSGPSPAILTVPLFAWCPARMGLFNLGKTYGLISPQPTQIPI